MKYFILFLVFVLSSCSTPPDKLGSANISSSQYVSYDCDQLASELTRKNKRLNDLYISLSNEAKADKWQMGVGMLVFWPTLFWLEGKDSAEANEYRLLKGETEAMHTASVQKKCGFK